MEGKIPPALGSPVVVEAPPHVAFLNITARLPRERHETIEHHVEDPATTVERLLDQNAGYFAAAEDLWAKVKPAIELFTERLERPRLSLMSFHEETGTVQHTAVSLEHVGREDLRSYKKPVPAATRQALGDINQW